MRRTWLYRGLAVLTVSGFGLLGALAELPSRLDAAEEEVAVEEKPIAIEMPKANEAPPPPEQEAVVLNADQLENLAPESFQVDSQVAEGFGTTFGSGGGGPAIRGGGGLGGGAQQLLSEQTNINRPARIVMRPPLEYPAEAKSRGVQGTVVVRVQVSVSGQADQIVIQESQPPGVFDQAILRSIRQWKFEPAIINGQVTVSWVTQSVRFEVE